MSHTLAVLHWHTKIDAMDVEFVIGSSPAEEQSIRVEIDASRASSLPPQTSTYEEAKHSRVDFTKRVTALWMIDFDDCNDIAMNSSGVDMAVKAFLDTNFYCPRPETGDAYIDTLWTMFSEKYLQYSDFILEDVLRTPDLKNLPRQFIQKIAVEAAQRHQGSIEGTSHSPSGSSFGSWRRGSRATRRGNVNTESEHTLSSQSGSSLRSSVSYGGSWRRGRGFSQRGSWRGSDAS
ncbi:zinc finger protein-domain-containing protein [Lasiosphaeria ovina]|uniref:Zinc finger protein-domain-containing protein n=1 Tax=Lasiosphaeria ovina TaxID=92902 RepID=A0AAE0KLS0_9PEZI|nr:zinc finger protein-domain-containing protein [Lasiosphaeria ovina]